MIKETDADAVIRRDAKPCHNLPCPVAKADMKPALVVC